MPEAPESDLLDSSDAGPAASRGGIVRVAGYGIGVLVTVGSAAVLIRSLGEGEDGIGRYVLLLTIATLGAGITDAGLSTLGVRELSVRGRLDRGPFLANLLTLRLCFTLVGGVLGVIYAWVVVGGTVAVAGTAIAGVGVLMANLQSTYATVLMAGLRLGWVTAIELGRQIVTAALIVAVALAGGGLLAFLAVAPVAGALAVVATVLAVRGSLPLLPRFDAGVCRSLLAKTLPFAVAAAVGVFYYRAAVLGVNLLSTEYQADLFGVSFRITEVLIAVPGLVITAALPIFSRAGRDDQARFGYGVGLAAQAVTLVGAAVGVGLVAGAPIAIRVLGGDEFQGAQFDDAVSVVRWHGLALLLTFAATPWGYALVSREHYRLVLAQVSAACVVLIVGLVVLVPRFGADGGAQATLAGEAALALFGFWLLRRTGTVIRIGWVPKVVVVTALAMVPVLLLPAIPAVVVAELVLIAGFFLTRSVPDEVLDLLPDRVRRRG